MSLIDSGLRGRTAMIFGASSGLGLASARALASEGAHVVLLSRTQEKLDAVAADIRQQFAVDAHSIPVDINDEAALAKALADVPNIDVLVTNCGGPPVKPFESISLDEWDAGYTSQMRSVVQACQALVPGMAKRGWGRVVMITSITVVHPYRHFALSNTIRPGLEGLCATLTQEYAGKGVTANIVCPGITATDRIYAMLEKQVEQGISREAAARDLTARIPVGRMGRPEELGETVAFLASDKAGYISGQRIVIDGGQSVDD